MDDFDRAGNMQYLFCDDLIPNEQCERLFRGRETHRKGTYKGTLGTFVIAGGIVNESNS